MPRRRGSDRGRRKKRDYEAEFWERESEYRKTYLRFTDFKSKSFDGTDIAHNRSKFGGYISLSNGFVIKDVPDWFRFVQKGDGRRSRYLTLHCKDLSRETGIEFFNYYVPYTTNKKALKRRKERIATGSKDEMPFWLLNGYYFQVDILKRVRLDEKATQKKRDADAARKRKQRERERLARLAAQKPLIEEILKVLNTILSIRIELEKISTHELICTDSLTLYDREKEIWTLEEGIYEVDTENAKNWLREFGNRFRDGTLAINTKNPLLRREINEVMQFGKK